MFKFVKNLFNKSEGYPTLELNEKNVGKFLEQQLANIPRSFPGANELAISMKEADWRSFIPEAFSNLALEEELFLVDGKLMPIETAIRLSDMAAIQYPDQADMWLYIAKSYHLIHEYRKQN